MSPGGFNLSDWAIRNRSVTLFLMAVVLIGGVSAFFGLGRAEDPPFTFRTMVVRALWPGASLQDTRRQVTERLERRLQEVPNLDNLRSFTRPSRCSAAMARRPLGSPSPCATAATRWPSGAMSPPPCSA